MRRTGQAFTLIEISISIFILMMLLALAVPSLTGVMKDRRLRRSLDDMNRLVQLAQERSVNERRPYLISWQKEQLIVRPETFAREEEEAPTKTLPVRKGDTFLLKLPAALVGKPPGDWVFWPSGACEPAIVSFKGIDGSWIAKYAALTGRAEISAYATN
jgi:type II secretory pathway pseudopilin PulG